MLSVKLARIVNAMEMSSGLSQGKERDSKFGSHPAQLCKMGLVSRLASLCQTLRSEFLVPSQNMMKLCLLQHGQSHMMHQAVPTYAAFLLDLNSCLPPPA